LKAVDWRPVPADVPLELVVIDPRGLEIRSQMVRFGREGFEEYQLKTEEAGLTGTYQFSLYVIEDGYRKGILGSANARVEEFQPDRMVIKAELSQKQTAGWLTPEGLDGNVELKNLFGTPAAGRTVKGSLKLYPSLPAFSQFPGYRFFD